MFQQMAPNISAAVIASEAKDEEYWHGCQSQASHYTLFEKADSAYLHHLTRGVEWLSGFVQEELS